MAPVLIDDQVLHQLSFNIGAALMTDDITADDMRAFIVALGFPRATGTLIQRLGNIVQAIVAIIPEMNGPARKRIGDAIAEQARWLAPTVGVDVKIPERDLVVINRP